MRCPRKQPAAWLCFWLYPSWLFLSLSACPRLYSGDSLPSRGLWASQVQARELSGRGQGGLLPFHVFSLVLQQIDKIQRRAGEDKQMIQPLPGSCASFAGGCWLAPEALAVPAQVSPGPDFGGEWVLPWQWVPADDTTRSGLACRAVWLLPEGPRVEAALTMVAWLPTCVGWERHGPTHISQVGRLKKEVVKSVCQDPRVKV